MLIVEQDLGPGDGGMTNGTTGVNGSIGKHPAQFLGRGNISYTSNGTLRIAYEGDQHVPERGETLSFLRGDMTTLFNLLWHPASANSAPSLVSPYQSGYSGLYMLFFRMPHQDLLFYVASDTYTLRGLTLRSDDRSKFRYEFLSWTFGGAL